MEQYIASAACARSGGPGLGNFEGAAIDRSDIENFAWLARGAVRDLRVPERVAVLHPRVARALVPRVFDGGVPPDADPPHGARAGPLPVLMHPDDAGDGDHGG